MSTITTLIRPGSPEEAVEAFAAASGTTLYLSGGTVLVHAGATIDTAVDLCGIGADRLEASSDGSLVLGACVRIGDIARSEAASSVAGGVLSRAASGVANHTIRNLATLGGNLVAWHFPTDLPPVLLALDAVVRAQTASGTKEFPLESFYADRRAVFSRGDIIIAVRVPKARSLRASFQKVGRKRLDVAIASAAAAVGHGVPDGVTGGSASGAAGTFVRLALGGLGVAPARAREAEAFLEERGIDEATVDRAAVMAVESAGVRGDRRASAEYRSAVAVAAAARALREAAGLERQ